LNIKQTPKQNHHHPQKNQQKLPKKKYLTDTIS